MLSDVKQIKQLITDMNRNIHTSIPGKIVSVDTSNNTCSVQPSGKYKKADGTYLDYPQIDNVPLNLMQGNSQKASITYPIKEGDGCTIQFMEQQLDNWKGENQEPATDLRFDLTNAVVTPGLSNGGNSKLSDACDNDAICVNVEQADITVKKDKIEIKLNGTYITVEDGKINIESPGEITVKGDKVNVDASSGDVVIQGISLKYHMHQCTAPGAPSGPAIP